jgi:hypothetical protein
MRLFFLYLLSELFKTAATNKCFVWRIKYFTSIILLNYNNSIKLEISLIVSISKMKIVRLKA